MDYSYIAYTSDRRLVKGKVSAGNEQAAVKVLNYGGYQVVKLKAAVPFLSLGKLSLDSLFAKKVKPEEIMLFSRQFALLIESGMDIVTGLELLKDQVSNRTLQKAINEMIADIHEGQSLSIALSKHPRVFPTIYHRAMAAGEQGGNVDLVLRHMADFMEKSINTRKKIKTAMTYPVVVVIVAIIVVAVLSTFVLPTFASMFSAFGANVPPITKALMGFINLFTGYGMYLVLLMIGMLAVGLLYTKTAKGKYDLDRLLLTMPVLGRINLLNELALMSRIISMLFKSGLPLPEIMKLAIQGTNNKVIAEALTGVQQELVRGEGLSRPMSRRKVFLPLMVQMVAIGEETGNLTNALNTIAASYETESDDRTQTAVGLIQPAIIILICLVVAFIAVALVSTMYGLYGQMGV